MRTGGRRRTPQPLITTGARVFGRVSSSVVGAEVSPHLELIILRGSEDDADTCALGAVAAVEAFAFGVPELHVIVDGLYDLDQKVRAFLRCPAFWGLAKEPHHRRHNLAHVSVHDMRITPGVFPSACLPEGGLESITFWESGLRGCLEVGAGEGCCAEGFGAAAGAAGVS